MRYRLLTHCAQNTNTSMKVSLPLSKLNINGPVTALDLWADAKPLPGGPIAEKFEPPDVGPRDSGFYKLLPQSVVQHVAA